MSSLSRKVASLGYPNGLSWTESGGKPWTNGGGIGGGMTCSDYDIVFLASGLILKVGFGVI